MSCMGNIYINIYVSHAVCLPEMQVHTVRVGICFSYPKNVCYIIQIIMQPINLTFSRMSIQFLFWLVASWDW